MLEVITMWINIKYFIVFLYRVSVCAHSWTIACQTSLSMKFSRQEYRSGLSFPALGDLPDPGIEPTSLGSPALVDRFFTTEPSGNPIHKPWGLAKKKRERCVGYHSDGVGT